MEDGSEDRPSEYSRSGTPFERTDRRRLPPEVGDMLRRARRRRGLSYRRAAAVAGTSPGYLWLLEAAERCPSTLVALDLADALHLDHHERSTLLDHAVDDAGRSSPWRGRSTNARSKKGRNP